MILGYEKVLRRIKKEAQSILKEHEYPTSATELIGKNIQASNHLVSKAQGVVLGAHYLRKEIEKNRIHHALNRLFGILDAYDDMIVYVKADAFDPNSPIITPDYFKLVR